MKNIINKLICKIFGHKFYNLSCKEHKIFYNFEYILIIETYECKMCGFKKYDFYRKS